MTRRFLDPTNDIAFKKIFGTEAQKPSLISFLNAILRLPPENRITEGTLMPQEESPRIDGGRRVIFDVKCRDQQGHEFIVEMQNRKVPDFIKRSQYYVSHCYVSQIGEGTLYFELKPVVLIAISNFELFSSNPDPISYHRILDEKTGENHLKDLSYVFVELPKFEKSKDDLVSVEDKWLYFLKHAAEENDVPHAIIEKEIREAYKTLERFNWDAPEYDAYVQSDIAITDEYRRQEKKYEAGLKEGKEAGMREGKEAGMKEGKEVGMKEGKEAGMKEGKEAGIKQIARELLKSGQEFSFVASVTGLTEEELALLSADS